MRSPCGQCTIPKLSAACAQHDTKAQGWRCCSGFFWEVDIMVSHDSGLRSVSRLFNHWPISTLSQDCRERVLCMDLDLRRLVHNSLYGAKGYPQEWFPSVSATIGDRYPERSVFQLFIAITSGQHDIDMRDHQLICLQVPASLLSFFGIF